LQDAQVIREVKYPVWLANTVPVKKKNGKWRMCVDFTDLNMACKKDDFPLEKVDKIVDDAANSEMLSLLDMFSGYHQIRVRKEDEEKQVSSLLSKHFVS
jgi:ribosomal protein S4E